jgi:hypothetical protein
VASPFFGITESFYTNWVLSPSSLTVASNLATASIKSGTQEKSQGHTTMTFKRSAAPTTRTKGCTTTTTEPGNLTGSLRWVTGTSTLKTITESSLKATLTKTTTKGCPPPPHCPKVLSINAFNSHNNMGLFASKPSSGASMPVAENWSFFIPATSTKPGVTTDTMGVLGAPTSWFTASNDLKSATLATPGGSPPLTGSDAFSGSNPSTYQCNSTRSTSSATGPLTGNLKVHYIVVGTKVFTTGGVNATIAKTV